jgi:hypothetical protein
MREVRARASEPLDVTPLCNFGGGVDLLIDFSSGVFDVAPCAPLPQAEADDKHDEDGDRRDE